MRRARHAEGHFTARELVRDVVIGMADGLTVPFALAAGLSGAVDSTTIVVVAGGAEIAEHYATERQREAREVGEVPGEEAREIAEIFSTYGVTASRSPTRAAPA